MPALLTVLLFLFLDGVCRVLWSPTVSPTSFGYLEALLFSCALWGTFAFVRSMLPRAGQWLIAAGVACLIPVAVLANFVLYREVGEYFTFSWLTPITDELSLGIDYFVGWASWSLVLNLCASCAGEFRRVETTDRGWRLLTQGPLGAAVRPFPRRPPGAAVSTN